MTDELVLKDEGGRRPPFCTICHVTTVHPPFDTRVFHKECVSLSQAGYDIRLVACHDRDDVVQGVRIHALPFPPTRLAGMFVWPWKAMEKVLSIRPRPRIVHFHDPELLPMGLALRLKGFQVIFDVHENIFRSIPSKKHIFFPIRWIMAKAYWGIERFLVSAMPSVHVMESIAKDYPPPRVVLFNYPTIKESCPETAREFHPPWRLIYVGGVAVVRGTIRMLQLLRDLLDEGFDVSLQIVGPIEPESLRDTIEEFIKKNDLDKHVEVPGRLSYETSQDMMDHAHIGLCLLDPTHNFTNSLPLKGFEYMLHGLPSIASRFDCWKPVFTDSGSGVLVNPRDRQEILDAAKDFLNHPEKMAKMGRNGQLCVYEKCNWQTEFKKMLAFYDELLSRRV